MILQVEKSSGYSTLVVAYEAERCPFDNCLFHSSCHISKWFSKHGEKGWWTSVYVVNRFFNCYRWVMWMELKGDWMYPTHQYWLQSHPLEIFISVQYHNRKASDAVSLYKKNWIVTIIGYSRDAAGEPEPNVAYLQIPWLLKIESLKSARSTRVLSVGNDAAIIWQDRRPLGH